MVTSISSFPLNDVENDADVSLTVSDRRASLLLNSEMTCANIHTFLKNKALTIVSYSEKYASDCWKRFGFPAVIDENGKMMKKFDKFVSCQKCFVTYSFKSNSTSQMNKYNCESSLPLLSSTNSQACIPVLQLVPAIGRSGPVEDS